MSQNDNLYSEISKTRAQWQTLLASYFKKGLRPTIVNLGSFSDGTRYAVTDQYRDVQFYLVTDLTRSPQIYKSGSSSLIIPVSVAPSNLLVVLQQDNVLSQVGTSAMTSLATQPVSPEAVTIQAQLTAALGGSFLLQCFRTPTSWTGTVNNASAAFNVLDVGTGGFEWDGATTPTTANTTFAFGPQRNVVVNWVIIRT